MRRSLPAVAVVAALVLTGCGELSEQATSAPRSSGAGRDTTRGTTPADVNDPDGTESGGDDEGDTAGEPSGDTALLCDAARRIRSLDDDADAITSDLSRAALDGDLSSVEGAFSEMISELRELLPDLEDAYDDLRAAVGGDLRQSVDALRSFTLQMMEQMTAADSLESFGESFAELDPEDTMAAASATLDIDEVTRRECGVSIAG